MNKHIIPILVILLFIVSAVSPMVIGFKSDAKVDIDGEMETLLDNLAFYCYDASGSNAKYEYYKEQMLKDYSNDDIQVIEEVVQPVEPISATTSGGPMDSPWPMKCHDNRHTSRSPYSTANNSGYEKWRFRSEWDGTMESSAVIGKDGIIYFGTMGTDCTLYALYPNGTKKWEYNLANLIWSTPAIAEDGTIYVGSWDNYLHAVYPNGTRKWKFDAGDSISSSPAIAENGTIYFGTMGTGYGIYAVNPNGTEKWHYDTGYKIVSDPAVGDDGTIYIGSGDTYLYALYPNGTLCWRFKTGDWVKSHPSIANDGTIYFDSFDDYLYALYPNGTMKWRIKGVGTGCGSAAISADGTIYFGDNKLHAIYPNGTIKWSLKLGGSTDHSSPAISADGTIYVSAGKSLVAVNPDGTEKWRRELCNLRADSSPCIGEDGTIYVGSSWEDENTHMWFGYLHAFGELDPNAPDAPAITGETSGKAGKEYEYKFASTDPNDDDVYYYIEWEDGAVEEWIGPYSSGVEITLNHTWKEKGTYTIRARAKDTNNLWGPWGELEVTMPKNQQVSNMWFLWWLERFPLLQQLLGWFV